MWLAVCSGYLVTQTHECYSEEEAEKACKGWEDFYYDEEAQNVVVTYVCEVKSTKRTQSYC